MVLDGFRIYFQYGNKYFPENHKRTLKGDLEHQEETMFDN